MVLKELSIQRTRVGLSYNMLRILVTGSKGMIGSRLFKKLESISVDFKNGHSLTPEENKTGIVYLAGIDVRSGHNLITTELPRDIDIIYHLAAQSSVEASWRDPVHDMDNVRMTARLVKEYPNAKIIYAASSATPTTSPYGFSKWASAEYIKNFHKNYVICTLPNVYGERGGKSVVDIFKDSDEVIIYGDGKQTRSYIHVDDIVEGLILAKDWDVGTYYLGDGKATSVNDLLRESQVVKFYPARNEAYEAVAKNTTPNWKPKINVINYLHEKNL